MTDFNATIGFILKREEKGNRPESDFEMGSKYQKEKIKA